MADDLIEGVEMKIGRQTLIVPPLNFKSLRRLRPQISLLGALDANAAEMSDEAVDALFEIIHTALRRNYPNLAREQIEEDLDIANAPKIITAIMNSAGLTRSGEAKPGMEVRSTGTIPTSIS